MKQTFFSADTVYKPYEYKGLRGRWAHWSALSKSAKRTFILVYGQHATLERIEPIAGGLREYGDVYVVDTPGFGGMDPSYRINEHPTLSFMGNHLKYFIEKYVNNDRELTVLGISYGFQIVTTMLAEHIDVCGRTELAISFVGFVNHKDFSTSLKYSVPLLYIGANFFRFKTTSKTVKYILRPTVFKMMFFASKPFNVKYRNLPKKDIKYYMDEQIWLWQINDDRTHGATAWDFFKKNDLTHLRLDVNAIHVGVPNDHFFDNSLVARELSAMYHSVMALELNLASHAPLDIDSPEKVKSLLPKELIKVLETSKNIAAVL